MLKKSSLEFIAFLQATGIFVYCLLIGTFMLNGSRWVGPTPNILGPVLFLTLFIVSAVTTSLLFAGYAFVLFWDHKQTKKALHLVVLTTLWLTAYLGSILVFLISQK